MSATATLIPIKNLYPTLEGQKAMRPHRTCCESSAR
jgi:hypothetical protein